MANDRLPFAKANMFPGDAAVSPVGAKTLGAQNPGDVHAEPPHAHRDVPLDMLITDTACRIHGLGGER